MNRGRPLISHDIIVNSIKATTTHTGLRVHAELDPGTYETDIKVTDKDIDAVPMRRHRFHGDWKNRGRPRACPHNPALTIYAIRN
ncbi:Rhodopirellula transposase DDE domain-containing protein [Streptomyces sp. MnatMP-M77]|nr:Rhodopirellula transposase DDE domain-containing protein [Streptomyces sp. MnatMP-M77]